MKNLTDSNKKNKHTYSFASDNHSGVHPDIMEAIIDVNSGHCASYEIDKTCIKARKKICELFDAQKSYFTFNGTAANVLALAPFVKSYESILCTDVSHLSNDECGAPEKHIGAKLILCKSQNGKIDLDSAKKKIIRLGDQHYSQVKAISITQPTELGTTYSKKELANIVEFTQKHKLYVHMDGSRLSNACYSLNMSLSEITKGFDSISFGGAKNGLMIGECVIFKNNNSELTESFKFLRKQLLQLGSKTRFIGAQFNAYLEDKLYLKIAKTVCEKAIYLKNQLTLHAPQLPIMYDVNSNAVFITIPKDLLKPARKKYFFYEWEPNTGISRLMLSFDTPNEIIDDFVNELKLLF